MIIIKNNRTIKYTLKYKVYSLWLNENNKLCICLIYTSKSKIRAKIWSLFHENKYWKIISKNYIKI